MQPMPLENAKSESNVQLLHQIKQESNNLTLNKCGKVPMEQ
jgi:hypothetical protein